MKADPACAWTDDMKYDGDRCQSESNLISLHKEEMIRIKSVTNVKSKRKETIYNPYPSTSQQMFPFRYEVLIRPGDIVTLTIMFKQLVDHPVDLYFLIDNSHTMQKYKDQLVKIIDTLSKQLSRITKDYTLGYGSFVDKPLSPFTEPLQEIYPDKCVS